MNKEKNYNITKENGAIREYKNRYNHQDAVLFEIYSINGQKEWPKLPFEIQKRIREVDRVFNIVLDSNKKKNYVLGWKDIAKQVELLISIIVVRKEYEIKKQLISQYLTPTSKQLEFWKNDKKVKQDCKYCRHVWLPRTLNPDRCPKCHKRHKWVI